MNVPKYFDNCAKGLIRPQKFYPFSYESSDNTFSIGDTSIEASDFDPHYIVQHTVPLQGQEISLEKLVDYPLLLPLCGNLLAGPRLHNWAIKHAGVISQEVAPIMQTIYIALATSAMKDLLKSRNGDNPFEAGISDGKCLELRTQGIDSYIRPKPKGRYADGLEHGFAEYELHNPDTQGQRTGLYAGLGHLAKLAGEA